MPYRPLRAECFCEHGGSACERGGCEHGGSECDCVWTSFTVVFEFVGALQNYTGSSHGISNVMATILSLSILYWNPGGLP